MSEDTETAAAPADPTPPVARPRAPGWMRALLVLSLSANLLVAGLVVGALVGRHDRMMMPRDPASAAFLGALPEAHRNALGERMRAEAGARSGASRQMRADLGLALSAIRAEQFRPEVLRDAIGRQRGRLAERVALGDRLLIEAIAAMTREERLAYADRIEEELRRLARHGR